MLNYKIIASDLDGTLLKDDKTISEENYRAIHAYSQMGGHFVPSSGRTLTEIPALVRNIPDVRYVMFSDGAGIYDKKTGSFDTVTMTGEEKQRLLQILWRYDTVLTVRSGGKCYVDAALHQQQIYDEHQLSVPYRDFLFRFAYPKGNFKQFCQNLPGIEMICVFFRYDAQLDACREELEKTGDYNLMASEIHNLEIVSKHAGKGKGLLRLAEKLGVAKEQTIGVGDSSNDEESIRLAGLGVAMGNSWPELKAIADTVICTNEEHFVAHLMRNCIRDTEATRLLLIRHGQSMANGQGVFAGHVDFPLTDIGLVQAECTARYIAGNYQVDAVYASDLCRAHATGEAAGKALGLSVSVDPGLREIYAGQWEGCSFDRLQTEFAESYGIWLGDIGNAGTDGGETVAQLQQRVVAAVKTIARRHVGQTVVIATHATPIRALQCYCEGKTLDEMKNVPWASNASVTEILYRDGEFSLVEASYDRHLGELVSKFPKNV